jgi:hypothetical protein
MSNHLKQLLTLPEISFGSGNAIPNLVTEELMNAPTSSAAADKSVPLESEVEVEIVDQKISRLDAERIRSSIVRLTSNSIDGLGSLSSELQTLEKFIEFEVERVQGEIESALAGIKIIIDTIAPWKSTPVSPSTSPRGVPAGPAANIELAQPGEGGDLAGALTAQAPPVIGLPE